MDRIIDASNGNARVFTDGNDLAGIAGTLVTATWLTGVQEEMIETILAGGQVPNVNDNTLYRQSVSTIGRRIAVFTGSVNWVVPDRVTRILALVWGAGGGSGGCNGSGSFSYGGGGGGFALGLFPVTPGSTVPITVGVGGTAGVGGSPSTGGGAGSMSSCGTLCSATGGMGGAGDGNYAGASVAAGGIGVGGQLDVPGCTCSSPLLIQNAVVTSQGGAAFGGMTAHFGATATTSASGGVQGQFPGGGAAGAASGANGSIGASGLVLVFY